MKIAIIGTGNVGQALGASFARAGHEVVYGKRGDAEAQGAASVAGNEVSSNVGAAQQSDIVVLAVPYQAVRGVAAEIAAAVDGKIVIDVTNPLKPDYSGLETDAGGSAAEQVASVLTGAKVVKAFNTLFAQVQAEPATLGVTVDAMFATDHQDARSTVAELVRSLEFRPVYVGPLTRARQLEAIAFLNISLQMQEQGDWRTAMSLVGAPPSAVSGAPVAS